MVLERLRRRWQIVARNGRHDSDDDVRQLSRALLVECERAEALSDRERVEVSVMTPHPGRVLGIELVRSGPEAADGRVVSFEELLADFYRSTQVPERTRR